MKEKKGISASTLKMIAVITMLADHIGAVIVERMLYGPEGTENSAYTQLQQLDALLRGIGRISFPIFCFLLVEGFLHTHKLRAYALRLFLFGLLSEIPFDLAFRGKIWDTGCQNVFFTLLIGLLTMWSFQIIGEQQYRSATFSCLLKAVALLAGIALTEGLRTDYAGEGIVCIMVLYICRKNRLWQSLAGAVSFYWELPAPLAFLPVLFYNGSWGIKMKYFFYVFYPVHLLLLYLFSYFLVST